MGQLRKVDFSSLWHELIQIGCVLLVVVHYDTIMWLVFQNQNMAKFKDALCLAAFSEIRFVSSKIKIT